MSGLEHIILSPHLDDAAMSMGGTIAMWRARGERVRVVTVCTGEPSGDAVLPAFVAEQYERAKLTVREVMQIRRAEDERAMRLLDAEYEWLGEPDAAYRLPHRYDRTERLYGEVAPDDPLLKKLESFVQSLPDHCEIYGPLGVGRHVDHQIVHRALRDSRRAVLFYEDFPYVIGSAGALERRLYDVRLLLEPVVMDVSGHLEKRAQAMAAYQSQHAGATAGLEGKMIDYTHRVGSGRPAERLWHVRRWSYRPSAPPPP